MTHMLKQYKEVHGLPRMEETPSGERFLSGRNLGPRDNLAADFCLEECFRASALIG